MVENKFLRKFRLLNKSDFQNLRSDSRFFASECFLFYYKENDLPYSRIGTAISKKVGNAPKRNYCKRVVKEIFRTYPKTNRHHDIVIVLNLKNFNKKYHKSFNEFKDGFRDSLNHAFKSLL